MSRARVLIIVALSAGLVILFGWVFATQPVRTRPIELKDLAQLAWPTLILIITLVGVWLRRRANDPPRPARYPGEPLDDRDLQTSADKTLQRDVISGLLVAARIRSRALGLAPCTDIRTMSAYRLDVGPASSPDYRSASSGHSRRGAPDTWTEFWVLLVCGTSMRFEVRFSPGLNRGTNVAITAAGPLREASEVREALRQRYEAEEAAEARRSAMTRIALFVAVGVLLLELYLANQWLGLAVTVSMVGVVGGFLWLCSAGFLLIFWGMAAVSSVPADPNSPAAIRWRRLERAVSFSIIVAIAVIAVSLLNFVASIYSRSSALF